MNCMKCGRDIKENQVFCDVCLTDMEKYPVRPDVAVQIPHRTEPQPSRKAHLRKRQVLTVEEQLAALKKKYRRLLAVAGGMLLLIVALGILAGTTIHELDVQKFLGQNYSSVGDGSSTELPLD